MAEDYLGRMKQAYAKKGIAGIDKEVRSMMVALRLKYTDHLNYFDALSGFYATMIPRAAKKKQKIDEKKIKTRLAEIKNAISLVEEVQGLIEVVFGGAGRVGRPEEIDELFKKTQEVELVFDNISSEATVDMQLADIMAEAEKKTGLEFENLVKTQKEVFKSFREKGVARETIISKIKEAAPELAEFGASLKAQATIALFGPFAGMAMTAGRVVKRMTESAREKKLARERLEAGIRITPISEAAPEGTLAAMEAARGRGPEFGGVARAGVVSGVMPGMAPIVGRGRKPVISTIGETRRGRAGRTERARFISGIALGIRDFFRKYAYQEKYTAELIQKIGAGAAVGGAGLFGLGLTPVKIGRIARIVLPIAGLVWAGIDAARGVGKAREWFGVPEGERVTPGRKVAAGVGGFVGGVGPGVGEEGFRIRSLLAGAGKGALIGFGVAGPLGAIIGAAVGTLTHAIGGKRIAKAIYAAADAWREGINYWVDKISLGMKRVKEVWSAGTEFWGDVGFVIKKKFFELRGDVTRAVESVGEGITAGVSLLKKEVKGRIDAVKGVFKSIGDTVGRGLDLLSKIPGLGRLTGAKKRQFGGIAGMFGPEINLLGETEPEMVTPLSQMTPTSIYAVRSGQLLEATAGMGGAHDEMLTKQMAELIGEVKKMREFQDKQQTIIPVGGSAGVDDSPFNIKDPLVENLNIGLMVSGI